MNVIEYSDGSAITREACAWIAQLDGVGSLSEADREALQEWMQRSPAHRDEIHRLAAIWSKMPVLSVLAESPALKRSRTPPVPRVLIMVPLVAVAAVCCIAVMVLLGLDSTQVQKTAVGEQRRVLLDDGSIVTINTASLLEIRFRRDARVVDLVEGEAHFEVQKNPGRPFIVRADGRSVRAVGTAFSVRKTDAGLRVSVTEGLVKITSDPDHDGGGAAGGGPSTPLMLDAGKVAELSAESQAVSEVPEEVMARELAWRGGMVEFEGERLEDVLAEVSRYTPQRFVFRDRELRELRIGGQFKAGETTALLDAIEDGFEVDIEREGDEVILARRAVRSSQ